MFVPILSAAGLAIIAVPGGWGLAAWLDRFESHSLRLGAFAGLLVLSLLPITLHVHLEMQGSLWGLQEMAANEARYGEDTVRSSEDAMLWYTWGTLIGGLLCVAVGTAAADRWPILGALTPGVALVLYGVAVRRYQDAFLRQDGALVGGGDVALHLPEGHALLMVVLLTGVAQVGLLAFAGRMQFDDESRQMAWGHQDS